MGVMRINCHRADYEKDFVTTTDVSGPLDSAITTYNKRRHQFPTEPPLVKIFVHPVQKSCLFNSGKQRGTGTG